MISFRRKFTYWFPLVTIALSPVYLATPTLGQEIEEIIVTARQRAESLQDVPASVQVFTGQRIQNSGIQRASDFVNLTPGVTIVDAAEVDLVEAMIEELDKIETDTDDKQAALRAALFLIEDSLNPIDAVFMYKVIELTGEIADMAERVGRRLELLLSH